MMVVISESFMDEWRFVLNWLRLESSRVLRSSHLLLLQVEAQPPELCIGRLQDLEVGLGSARGMPSSSLIFEMLSLSEMEMSWISWLVRAQVVEQGGSMNPALAGLMPIPRWLATMSATWMMEHRFGLRIVGDVHDAVVEPHGLAEVSG
jgi:hypothetical protein